VLLAGFASFAGQELRTATGSSFSVQETVSRGPAVLVFWNSWIPGGAGFVPVLLEVERAARQHGVPGAIVVFQDDSDAWEQTIGAPAAGLPRVLDRRGVLLREFKVTRAPTVLVVDRTGKVLERTGPDAARVRSIVERLGELGKGSR